MLSTGVQSRERASEMMARIIKNPFIYYCYYCMINEKINRLIQIIQMTIYLLYKCQSNKNAKNAVHAALDGAKTMYLNSNH